MPALLSGVANAATFHWHRAIRLEPVRNGGLDAVSCANAKFCVAADQSGDITWTLRPTAGNGAWSRPVHVDSAGPITGVSCPTPSFCAAVDASGSVVYSLHPTKGARFWSRPVRIDAAQSVGGGPAGLSAISCPSARLCVAVDAAANANVLVSTNPTGGKAAWSTVALEGPATSVSCSTTTLCVIGGSQRYVSTDPTSPTAWKAGGALQDGVYASVDCVGLHLCVGVGFSNSTPGLASATATPTGAWSAPVAVLANPPAISSGLLDTVGCTRGTCVALDGFDNAYVSSHALKGLWSAGRPIRPKSASQFNAVSCTSGLCVVVDSAGVETTGILS
jgi:hypothetical protein